MFHSIEGSQNTDKQRVYWVNKNRRHVIREDTNAFIRTDYARVFLNFKIFKGSSQDIPVYRYADYGYQPVPFPDPNPGPPPPEPQPNHPTPPRPSPAPAAPGAA